MIVVPLVPAPGLAPVEAALATVRSRRGPTGTRGLQPGLLVPAGAAGWFPARRLLDEAEELDHVLAVAARFWSAPGHVAASLAWRSYTYWLVMPVVLGWAAARRVPLVDPEDVMVQVDGGAQLLRIGLRRLRLAVLPDDPLAAGAVAGRTDGGSAATAEVVVTAGEPELQLIMRRSLRDAHLDPLLSVFRGRSRLGRRTLLGSVASAAGYAVLRGVRAPAGQLAGMARGVLAALEVGDLVDLPEDGSGPQLRRRTCCLAFALPRPKVCSGCPLS